MEALLLSCIQAQLGMVEIFELSYFFGWLTGKFLDFRLDLQKAVN